MASHSPRAGSSPGEQLKAAPPDTIVFPFRTRPARQATEDQDLDSPTINPRKDRYMNQSLIALIANVGSTSNIASPPLGEGEAAGTTQAAYKSAGGQYDWEGHMARPWGPTGKITSEHNLLRSLPALRKQHPAKKQHKSSSSDAMTSSQILVRPSSAEMSRPSSKLSRQQLEQALDEQVCAVDQTAAVEADEQAMVGDASESPVPLRKELDLADALARIFGFKEREEIEAEYPCMLMQSSLLRGYLYILQRQICFYAYLPKQLNTKAKSGYMSKRGRKNPIYNRYWFILKGDVLSYYTQPSQLYFPRGTIDLRSAASVQLTSLKEKTPDTAGFSISTTDSAVYFKAESAADAKEWVKQIQTVIFRSQNEGESVKIALPVANVLDVEENRIMEGTDTFRVRVIDNDETYAVDEYFFSFFGCGPQALQSLRSVMDKSATKEEKSNIVLESVLEFVPRIPLHVPLPISGERDADERQNLRMGLESSITEEIARALDDDLGLPRQQEGLSKESRIDERENDSPPAGLLGENAAETPGLGRPTLPSTLSSTRLQEIFRAGAYPLQKASGIAGLLRTQSKRVGNMFATESLGYYEKAYSMWAGKKMHYDEGEGQPQFSETKGYDHELHHGDRFRNHFALPGGEKLQATYYAFLQRGVPVYGKIYVGRTKLCFRTLIPGTRTKMILPLKDVENVVQEKGFRFGYAGLVITIRGHEEIFFEFGESEARDDCILTLLNIVETAKHLQESRVLNQEELSNVEAAKVEHELLQQARRSSQDRGLPSFAKSYNSENDCPPILFDDPTASILTFKPPEPLRITCLTIGSRGDVQPFIALCKGFIAEGHKPTLATHIEFEDWIKGHGIEFAPIAGNPAEIMQLCVEHDMFTLPFIREAHAKFRGVIDDILDSAWRACQGTDLLIESPSAMAGIHVAEALQIPYFRAFTMPWTRTRAYPHAFAVPTQKLGGNYNMMTYVMFDNIFWQAMAGQINRWRRKTLGLPSTTLDKLMPDKVPFLYNFSPSVVVPPLDFNIWIHITGYWFLDEGIGYKPDINLANFIQKARHDGKKIVYVGFGSVVVDDPAELTRNVVAAILEADVRCILSKGWSDRLNKEARSKVEIPLPDAIFQIQSAPHDWLFRQVDAVAHHGGAGTTGASIRAGIPTIAKPFFGDQYFFGTRLQDLGVGVSLPAITSTALARALTKVTTDKRMIDRAKLLGEKVRSEHGVDAAIQAIYRDLDYAKSLIKRHIPAELATKDIEESWTLVRNESDPDIARCLSGPKGPEFQSSLAQRRLSVKSRGSAVSDEDRGGPAEEWRKDVDDDDASVASEVDEDERLSS